MRMGANNRDAASVAMTRFSPPPCGCIPTRDSILHCLLPAGEKVPHVDAAHRFAMTGRMRDEPLTQTVACVASPSPVPNAGKPASWPSSPVPGEEREVARCVNAVDPCGEVSVKVPRHGLRTWTPTPNPSPQGPHGGGEPARVLGTEPAVRSPNRTCPLGQTP